MSQAVVEYYELGLVDYASAFNLQLQLSRKVKELALPGFLLFLEHPPTITLGYSLQGDEGKTELLVSEEVIVQKGIKLFHTDRGGKATFHGPGQLVTYPIFNLNHFNLSSKKFVNKLEDTVLNWLQKKGIEAYRDLQYPGVWVQGKKIASVGVRIQDRVSRHGIALNLCPDLEGFDLIVPCGIARRKMTSFLEITGQRLKPEEVVPEIVREFAKLFDLELKQGETNILPLEGGRDDNQRMAHAWTV